MDTVTVPARAGAAPDSSNSRDKSLGDITSRDSKLSVALESSLRGHATRLILLFVAVDTI